MKTESQTFLETSKVTFILDPSGAWGHILDSNEEFNSGCGVQQHQQHCCTNQFNLDGVKT